MAFSYFIIWCLFCCANPLPCETQNVFFGFKNRSGADQALPLGEKNVTITCNVSCVENAIIKIKQDQVKEWLITNNVGTSLDYTIDEVFSMTFANFSCLVIYNKTESSGGVSRKSVGVDFSLPVFEDNKMVCRRNGTAFNAPYQTGDILSLQCFCLEGPCQWSIFRGRKFEEINSTLSNGSNDTVILAEATVANINNMSVFLCKHINDFSAFCIIQNSAYNKVIPSRVPSNECDKDHPATTDLTSYHQVNTTTHLKGGSTVKAILTKKPSLFESFFDELENLSTEVLILCVIGIVILIVTICIIITTGCLIKNAKGKIKEHDEEKKEPEESMYADIPEKMQESAFSSDVDRLYDAPPFMTKGVVPNYYIKQQ